MTTLETTVDTLDRVWETPAGLRGLFTAVNHRAVGTRYIITGMFFFVLAGVAALLMRIQLAVPEAQFLNPYLYNQLFTLHGTTMMFLFAVPIMEGIGIYLVPLMLGARDMAFPRLNAFGYWVYLIAGLTLWFSLLINSAPDGGWFAYTPLTRAEFSPAPGIDFYATMITFLEVAALVAAIELIVTIFLMRAPGMSIARIPLFVWSQLVMSFMIVFAMPSVMVATVQLALDRSAGTHFFNPAAGGDPLLWQHLFWFFGHPEVYIILLPALGMVAAMVPTFSRRPMIGYVPLVLAFIAIGFFSFGLWVHHMYAAGLPTLGLSLFTVASITIAVPSGVQIFATLATMWYGRTVFRVPMLYVLGFVIIFVLGGISGVMVASVPFDWQVHDTYFVVAHFHYVLIGGAVFPLLGGLHYWFPKITGRMMDERLGAWQFWLLFIGFNVTFFTMHITGFLGMPRRVYTFLPGIGWDVVNMISTIGAFLTATSVLLFIINVVRSWRGGALAGDNPWNAGTLEWATTSPPENYNFLVIPTVNSRYPLWEPAPLPEPYQQDRVRLDEAGMQESLDNPDEPAYQADLENVQEDRFGLYERRRESVGSSTLDALPEQRIVLPGPTFIPFVAALAVSFTFIGFMIDAILVPIGALLVFAAFVAWHWPSRQQRDMEYVKQAGSDEALPSSTVAMQWEIRPPFWWGLAGLVLIETVVFGALISSYFFLRSGALDWPLGGIDPPKLLLPSINALILLSSSLPMYLADKAIKKGDKNRLKIYLTIGILLAVVFLTLKVVEYSDLDYNWATNAYGSIVWTITGFHSAHVLALILKTAVIATLAYQNYFNEERNAAISANGLYWHFVVAIWIPLFLTLYISPYVLGN
jgi:cytochrome c oxidase subunit I+III